jgi:hypothetical protein
MRWIQPFAIVSILSTTTLVSVAPALYPEPAIVAQAWQLDFRHDLPRRIVVEVPGEAAPKAYWYITYLITNNTGAEQVFLPAFELVTKDGAILRSDSELSATVFDTIARRERQKPLQSALKIAGPLLQGEDQAKYGVAIFEEPSIEMGSFSVFAQNLSGEAAALLDTAGNPVKDADGNTITLRKTLQIDYTVSGDELFAGDPIKKTAEGWVMR